MAGGKKVIIKGKLLYLLLGM